jgi:hypothetical protein
MVCCVCVRIVLKSFFGNETDGRCNPKISLLFKFNHYIIFISGRDVTRVGEFSKSNGISFGQLKEKIQGKEI